MSLPNFVSLLMAALGIVSLLGTLLVGAWGHEWFGEIAGLELTLKRIQDKKGQVGRIENIRNITGG